MEFNHLIAFSEFRGFGHCHVEWVLATVEMCHEGHSLFICNKFVESFNLCAYKSWDPVTDEVIETAHHGSVHLGEHCVHVSLLHGDVEIFNSEPCLSA